MKNILRLFPLVVILFTISCNDDLEELPEAAAEPISFERVRPNLVGYRGNVGDLAVFHDRLYYSNSHNPGYFTSSGEHVQFAHNDYNMDMGQAINEDFLIGPLRNLKTLVFFPANNHSFPYVESLDITSIPGVPADAILSFGDLGKINFRLNDDHFLFTYHSSTGTNALIVQLNFMDNPNFGKHLINPRYGPQVLNVIPIDFHIEGSNGRVNVGKAFPYGDGWVASTWSGGLAIPLYIARDGGTTVIPQGLNYKEERMKLISIAHAPSGGIFATTEIEVLYSSSGRLEDLSPIANTNLSLRIRFIGERLICFIGRDNIFEIVNYTDSETIALRQLENKGLDDLLVRDIAYFHGNIYVATNAGLFTKNLEDFWEEKIILTEQMMESPLERLR